MPAKSKRQARAAGMAYAAKQGSVPVTSLTGSAMRMYNSMNEAQLRDFARVPLKKIKYRVLHKND